MIEDKKTIKPKVQNLIMENREKASVSGVVDVQNYNSDVIAAETTLGLLTVKGCDLKISKLNLDNNELIIEGKINSCTYSEIQPKGASGIFSRMFK